VGKKDCARRRRVTFEALEKQEGRCFYCHAPLSEADATADHRQPKSKGGTDRRENIVAACFPCNYAKSDLAESWFFKIINSKSPPRIGGAPMLMVWSTRRLWRRTNKACARIERASKYSVRVASASISTSQGNASHGNGAQQPA
jgi:hypothetical protein